jgi:Leucine-rich repeat (LRR) protein
MNSIKMEISFYKDKSESAEGCEVLRSAFQDKALENFWSGYLHTSINLVINSALANLLSSSKKKAKVFKKPQKLLDSFHLACTQERFPSKKTEAQKIRQFLKDPESEPLLNVFKQMDLNGKALKLIPEQINLFKSLRSLCLNGNELSSIPDLDLPNLTNLDISNNFLTSIPEFSKLAKLEHFDASKNRIGVSVVDFNLPNLIDCNLSENCIRLTPGFSKLTKLMDLNLSRNQLRGVNLQSRELQSLATLDVSHNKIVVFEAFEFPSLKCLLLNDNPIKELDKSKFANTKKLTIYLT